MYVKLDCEYFLNDFWRLGFCGFDINLDRSPALLIEPHDAEQKAHRVAREYGEPDVDRLKADRSLDDKTDADGEQDLRNDRDKERAFGIARALQSAGVGECHRDKQARDAQDAEQLGSDRDDVGVSHSENGE